MYQDTEFKIKTRKKIPVFGIFVPLAPTTGRIRTDQYRIQVSLLNCLIHIILRTNNTEQSKTE